MIVSTALRDAAQLLHSSGVETAALDARLLLQHVLGYTHEELLLREHETLSQSQLQQFEALVAARSARKPMAQIVGKRAFWKHEFIVSADTLIPRPDSETLIEAVLSQFAVSRLQMADKEKKPTAHRPLPSAILDLGTGTGCLLLSLLAEFPQAKGVGVDISESALSVALRNAQAMGLEKRVEFVKSDWHERIKGVFNVVVSNPPYISTEEISLLAPEVADFEPFLALDGGGDGLSCYRIIFKHLPSLLAHDGLAFVEIGLGQELPLKKIIAENHLRLAGTRQDLAGVTRCLIITHKENPSAK